MNFKNSIKLIALLIVAGSFFVVSCNDDESVSNQLPICSITAPTSNAIFFATSTISVEVTVEGTIAEVRLYIDNVEHDSKIAFPYNFTISAGTLTSGTHTLKAVAKDNQGVTAESTVIIDKNPCDEIIIADNFIQSPQWLVHAVNGMAHTIPSGGKLYPSVYSLKYNEQEYILVWDMVNSCWVCGNLYFTCTGDPINWSSLYEELMNFPRDNYILIWWTP